MLSTCMLVCKEQLNLGGDCYGVILTLKSWIAFFRFLRVFMIQIRAIFVVDIYFNLIIASALLNLPLGTTK